jgi:hypothetical protein
MQQKIVLFSICLAMSACFSPHPALSAGDFYPAELDLPQIDTSELSGISKLACEAILCLSSSVRPGECAPSLDHYFGIEKDTWSDTLDARKSFLKKCPVMDTPGMPELANAIANGAGFCDAAALNAQNRITVYRIGYRYGSYSAWRDGDGPDYPTCRSKSNQYNYDSDTPSYPCVQHKTVINNVMPSRCLNYFNHAFTYFEPLHYEGDKYDGGKWVD